MKLEQQETKQADDLIDFRLQISPEMKTYAVVILAWDTDDHATVIKFCNKLNNLLDKLKTKGHITDSIIESYHERE